MAILLDTGTLTTPSTTSVVDGTTIDNTASERVVYPSETEALIVVRPRQMVVVTAYGGSANISKVLLSNGIPDFSSGGCCPTISKADAVILSSVVIPCYSMSASNPISVIHVPGTYKVTPVGSDDDLRVTAMAYSQQNDGGFMACYGSCGGS